MPAQDAPARPLRGHVIDAYAAVPVANARVVLTSGRDTIAEARSDSAGFFEARVSAPAGWAHFMRIGYVPDSAEWRVAPRLIRVAMNRVNAPPTLAAVNVRAGMSAFDKRALRGVGRVITPERIAAAKPIHTSDLLRGLAGVRLVDSAGMVMAVTQRSLRLTPSGAAPSEQTLDSDAARAQSTSESCPMRVAIDGRLMLAGFSVNDVQAREIYGIEVYAGAATMPAEFAGLSNQVSCGLIMIWTKAARERERT